MRKITIILLLLCSLVANAQNELTNKSILDMIALGFSDDIIVAKIKTSTGNFDTSIEALKELKEKGVSDTIMVAIMNGKTQSTNINEVRTGIYIKADDKMIRILPTVFSGTKTNTLASAFTYGIADASIKSTLNGATSKNKILSAKPEFYFYFAKSHDNSFSVGASNWWFASATSPNEFSLVKLLSKRNKRELKTGKVNIYAGSEMGVDESQAIKFNITQIDDYSYKVTPESSLEPGEYCFFYQGIIPQGGFTNQSVFDFSIPAGYGVTPRYQVGDVVWVLKKGKPYYIEIGKAEVKEDGIYYTGANYFDRNYTYEESECYSSKKELNAAKTNKDEK